LPSEFEYGSKAAGQHWQMRRSGGSTFLTQFNVVSSTVRNAESGLGVTMQRDNWNDFGFTTQYHFHINDPTFKGYIGDVKVLRRGQTASDGHQLEIGSLAPLGNDFCSLGQSLDYYQRLAELPPPLQREILTHMRDCVFFPELATEFAGEEGWTTSILRYVDWENFFHAAAALLGFARVEMGFSLRFQVKGWENPLDLFFHKSLAQPPSLPEVARLPARVTVLTGRNGSGKSTLLARLARVLHASQRDRQSTQLLRLGSVIPEGIGFTRILNISYSAFDAFQIPGVDARERRQIAEDLKRGGGRYHFCGLRDIVRELEEGLDVNAEASTAQLDAFLTDRQRRTYLKAVDDLAQEFQKTVQRIVEGERGALFEKAIAILHSDPSFADLGPSPTSTIVTDPIEHFHRWSTGHKFVMHAISSMVAYTQPDSIVLIDEPETHLHPPLLAAMMHAIRVILDANKSFAVIATHSPVLAQETLGSHVAIVRRTDETTVIQPPRIETYGESIGEITDEVFGLNSNATDYHATLQAIVAAGLDLPAVERLFERGLSLQARAYVMTAIAQRGRF
jgi:predicted ATPase